ncbi:hypothetical protein [Actinomadura harenae]|uniref:Uncharacterized protein n=1 Tax=Actinomadura harenae TaxID=2483351 RepID=A0A3M2L3L8_9ACTN|nr:hypothetical protein [Actinomadura harenae]RMI31984.1 hypothetical protein EBO15_42365 [Actinomadura harenae]
MLSKLIVTTVAAGALVAGLSGPALATSAPAPAPASAPALVATPGQSSTQLNYCRWYRHHRHCYRHHHRHHHHRGY